MCGSFVPGSHGSCLMYSAGVSVSLGRSVSTENNGHTYKDRPMKMITNGFLANILAFQASSMIPVIKLTLLNTVFVLLLQRDLGAKSYTNPSSRQTCVITIQLTPLPSPSSTSQTHTLSLYPHPPQPHRHTLSPYILFFTWIVASL